MLPDRPPAESRALKPVMDLPERKGEIRLRIGMHDGTEVTGDLVAVSAGYLSLMLRSDTIHHFPADEIRTVDLGERRPFRELLVLAGVAGATTAVLVAAAQVPFL